MYPRKLVNSVWIFFPVTLYIASMVFFGYFFLFAEELHIKEDAVGEKIDSIDLWVEKLLSKSEYERYRFLNQHCNQTLTKSVPKFTKLVLFIIDAFRSDFVSSISNNDRFVDSLPYMKQLMHSHGIGFTSVASIPTVTLPRVKALLSGTLPSFIDYIMNLNAYKFKKDNIVEQLWRQEKKIVFYGDDTWAKIFSEDMFHRMNITSSLFATDYTEVDTNVTYNVYRDLQNLTDWDVMILHYLGVDHIGHLRGFNSDLFPAKLHEMDQVFRKIFDTITYSADKQDSYLIVITGDHGMTNSGNHGGNTRDETHTAMLFISTNVSHHSVLHSDQSSHPKMLQIDFATTIASLFNFETSPKNQGRIISGVLDRFQVPPEEHLCRLFNNLLQIQKLSADQNDQSEKNFLVKAFNAHYRHANGGAEDEFEISKHVYQKFLEKTQQKFVKTTQKSVFFSLKVVIAFSFAVVLGMLWIEYSHNRPGSIILREELEPSMMFRFNQGQLSPKFIASLNNYSQTLVCILYFPHLRFLSSTFGYLMALAIIILNAICMGSTSFMEYEHYFWYFVSQTITAIVLGLAIRSYLSNDTKDAQVKQYRLKIALYAFLILVLFKICVYWKLHVIQERDLANVDISSLLVQKQSKHILSSVYIVSLIAIVALTSAKSFGRLHCIFISSLFCIYLYRSQNGSISAFKAFNQLFISPKRPNLYAQIVFVHVLFIVFDWLLHKTKHFLPNLDSLKYFNHLLPLVFESRSEDSKKTKYCSLQACRITWLIMSILLVEPWLIPVLSANVLIENLVHRLFSIPEFMNKPLGAPGHAENRMTLLNQLCCKLVTYIAFAIASFYQLDNTNSLSTVSVSACFIGLNSYMPPLCAIFMIISIYSTYVYWILMFFIRVKEDLFHKWKLHDLQTNFTIDGRLFEDCLQIAVSNYRTFYSLISTLLITRFVIMSVNMSVTLLLRDHLFIWSVICPKFLYEFCFTILLPIITTIVLLIFTIEMF